MPENVFNERIARGYDAASADMFDPSVLDPTVRFLAELAGDGPALELGIGTGRVAVPLSQAGIPVYGIEISTAMADQLGAKPGAEHIGVTIGDFATTKVDGTFPLAYLVYNTIANLMTQAEQVACFQNAADHLAPRGRFVIEVFVPTLRLLPPGENTRAFTVTPTHVGFDEYDIANQTLVSHHYWFNGDKVETFFTPHRYVWAAELDLMARLAGLTLTERWANWDRDPFTSESTAHISVWQKP